MSKKAIRAVLSVGIFLSAFAGVMYTTVSEGAQYYKHVDEVMATPDQWYGKPMQLHGFVVDGTIMRRPDSLDHRFRIKTGEFSVGAAYTGLVPDTFKDGAEVVLTGRLTPDGFQVDPNGVTAKCPSKYEAAPPAGPAVK
jgi:cytochrome c-type biogenesis protein CcmE